jgi:hypothetical protein
MSDSDKFDVKSLFKLPKVVRSGEVNPHKYKMLDADLAGFPGQPSITFGDSANEVFIGVSPAPMVGMDSMIPCGINYAATITSKIPLSNDQAAEALCAIMEKLDLKYVAERQFRSNEATQFRIQLDKQETESTSSGPIYTFFAIITVEVEQADVDRIIVLLQRQLQLMTSPSNTTPH